MLDLGAGTGKLTTRLVERGLDVVAVDPIPEMLELLSNSLPDTPALLGTAEEIPLPDDSVDAVLVAQAWHWFDPERAVKEVARVLRPGGRLGLVWNTRDERLGWVKDLGRIIGHEDDPLSQQVTLPEPFDGVERHQVEWTSYLTPQALIDLVASRSYCITSPTDVRTQTLERVRELLATHPALANIDRPGAALRHGEHPRDALLTPKLTFRRKSTRKARHFVDLDAIRSRTSASAPPVAALHHRARMCLRPRRHSRRAGSAPLLARRSSTPPPRPTGRATRPRPPRPPHHRTGRAAPGALREAGR